MLRLKKPGIRVCLKGVVDVLGVRRGLPTSSQVKDALRLERVFPGVLREARTVTGLT